MYIKNKLRSSVHSALVLAGLLSAFWGIGNQTAFADCPSANPYIRYVDGSNTQFGDGSAENPYWTIQAALDYAPFGACIVVKAGTYEENITMGRSDVHLTSESGPAVTIIDGKRLGPVVTAINLTTPTHLSGFTLEFGQADNGGGIFSAHSNLIVSDCMISNNIANDSGGGIYCNYGSPEIRSCTIRDNAAVWGGGICGNLTDATIQSTTITYNNANARGGGVYFFGAEPTLEDATISYNTASLGGGVGCDTSALLIQGQTLISHNQASKGGGVYFEDSKPTIGICTIENNVATSYGGGIYCIGDLDEPATIGSAAIIRNNQAEKGGGIYCDNSSPDIINSYIDYNQATNHGGGILCRDGSAPTISNCWIRNNQITGSNLFEASGGGIYCDLSAPTITNSHINYNSARYGGGLYCLTSTSTTPSISNSEFYDNQIGPFSGSGGAMYVWGDWDLSKPMRNNVFSENGANFGGGLFCMETSIVLIDCQFLFNSGKFGGGMYCSRSRLTLERCEFKKNIASKIGGGIFSEKSSPKITNSTFIYNEVNRAQGDCSTPNGLDVCGTGGGIYFFGTKYSPARIPIQIANSTFYGNEAAIDGGAIFARVDFSDYPHSQLADLNIVNSILRNNFAGPVGDEVSVPGGDASYIDLTIDYSNIAGGWTGTGNIDTDPLFIDPSSVVCDFHLRPGSPCIDSGTGYPSPYDFVPDDDIDGDTRPQFNGHDMGADEFMPILVPGDHDTIQEAIIAAIPGDTIVVSPGTYPERIDFLGKAITVRSENGAGETTIDGEGVGPVVTFDGGESADSVLEGFTITNGNGTGTQGGGITCVEASPTISKCVITENTAVYGGGVLIDSASPAFVNCIIANNQIAGIFGTGGGVYLTDSSTSFTQCTIFGNYAYNTGGGLLCHDSSLVIVNSVFWENTDHNGVSEIETSGTGSVVDITYSIIQDGAPGDSSIYPGLGNRDDDPLFINASGGDFRLLAASPGVDNGTDSTSDLPADDFNGITRPQGLSYDMGAHEHPSTVVVPGGTGAIQAAIDAATPGSTVLVQDGTYFENIDFHNKAITVRSQNGPASTIIDGGASGSVVTFEAGESEDSVLEGFTITHGGGKEDGVLRQGGGIYCHSSSPTIRGCIIKDSTLSSPITGSSAGGGIYCNNASPSLINCMIIDNTTVGFSVGAGLYCKASSPSFVHCTLAGNWTGFQGGGIYCTDKSAPTVLNSVLWDNKQGSTSNQVHLDDTGSTITITYSDIDPATITGSGTPSLSDNINENPDFQDPANGNYHLLATSPCQEMGTDAALGLPDDDIDGDKRPAGDGYDMGSDEYVCLDKDSDGFLSQAGCGTPVDCNDRNPQVYPGASEICDGLDNDCDGLTDNDDPDFTGFFTFYRDADGDGQGTASLTMDACTPPTGYVSNADDCDDTDGTVYLGAPELCDGQDTDCDGLGDLADPDFVGYNTFYFDGDGDTFGDAANYALACTAPQDYVENDADCDDSDGEVNPGASEIAYNGKNDDCNSATPDDDLDDDGFNVVDDCDDNDGSMYPGAPELCDGLDNDCNTVLPADEANNDGDGFMICQGDCDDGNALVYPGVPEFVDGVDNDCDGNIDEINVGDEGEDDYGTIQEAIDFVYSNPASADRTIIVRAGVYPENIDFRGLAITVRSMDGPEGTTIDGTQSGSVVTFQSGEGSDSILEGFTITNGSGTEYYSKGGGIYCINSSAPTISHCIIRNNYADRYGGGVYGDHSPGITITDCVIRENTAGIFGGGVYSYGTPAWLIMTRCLVIGNQASNQGGGIYDYASDTAMSSSLTNCTITGNAALVGGGIVSGSSGAGHAPRLLTHCTISGNAASTVGGVQLYGGSLSVLNSIIRGNLGGINTNQVSGVTQDITIDYSNIEGGWAYAGVGNIDEDPLFADPRPGDEAPTTKGAYHLLSGSPCIDAGTDDAATYPWLPTDDIHHDTRPQDLGYDMGSDEVVEQTAAPSAPDALSATAVSAVAIDLAWTDNADNEQGVRIERKIGSGGPYRLLAVVGPDTETYQDTDLTADTEYSYQVIAYNNVGDSNDSNEASATTLANTVLSVCPGFYTTIQSAIDDAVDGDEVVVCDGVYSEQIDLSGKAITVRSENGRNYTTIDGNGSGTVVTFASGEKENTILQGFTITNGTGSYAGGIFCKSFIYSAPQINDCLITANGTKGVYTEFSSLHLDGCTVSNHQGSASGYGISLLYGVPQIDNCIISNNEGGGVKASKSFPVITNSLIHDNSGNNGGGVYCYSGTATFTGCTIRNNTARYGGGVSSTGSLNFSDCAIRDNTAGDETVTGSGGGIYAGRQLSLTDCVVSGNMAVGLSSNPGSGGGILGSGYDSLIVNSTITGNGAVQGGGLYATANDLSVINSTISGNYASNRGGGINTGYAITVVNTIVWGNTADSGGDEIWGYPDVTYCDIGGVYTGVGNMDADPVFINDRPASEAPTSAGDYHLQDTSPCIDDGSNTDVPTNITEDPDGNGRILDGDCNGSEIVDIGAFEVPCNEQCEGDVDGDGDVDGMDLAIFLGWYATNDLRADLDTSGVVEVNDIAMFAADLGMTDCP